MIADRAKYFANRLALFLGFPSCQGILSAPIALTMAITTGVVV